VRPTVSTKLLVHLAPAAGREEALWLRLREVAAELAAGGLEAASLSRIERDPFGPKTPWRGTLELRASEDALHEQAVGLAARFGSCLDAAASTTLVGNEHVLIAAAQAKLRYQYLMRRRHDFSHDAYLRRYREVHAQFGLRTPGILGYVQLHVDPKASRRAAHVAGFGVHDVDGVSELHLDSIERFLAAIAGSSIGAEAMADEEQFVDRARSFDFCSRVHRYEEV